jgi:hypothetical protein
VSAGPERAYETSALIAERRGLSYGIVADLPVLVGRHATFDGCRWDPGAGPEVGGRFTGWIDADQGRSRTLRCEVVAALRGRCFAFATCDRTTRWAFEFASIPGYTRVTATCCTRDGGAGFRAESIAARLTHTVRSVKLCAESLALTGEVDLDRPFVRRGHADIVAVHFCPAGP